MAVNADCPDCQGTGWSPVDDGSVVRCKCVGDVEPSERIKKLGLPPRFGGVGFDNFRAGNPRENSIEYNALTGAMGVAKKFAEEYPFGPKRGLLFQGVPGVGKTHLAIASLKRLAERGFDCIFFDYQTLLQKIRDGYDPAAGAGSRETYRAALDTEILLLDDLGAHRVTDWVLDTVTAIINHRYNEEKALIITTNLPVVEMGHNAIAENEGRSRLRVNDSLADRIGARAVSRLCEVCHEVRISTQDYRRAKR